MPKPYQLCTYSAPLPHKGTQPIRSDAHLHLSDVCLSNPTFHFAQEFVIHSAFDTYLWCILQRINQNYMMKERETADNALSESRVGGEEKV